jgi:hypothetical protein
MMLNSDLEIVDGLPVLYIKSLGALVCSDLHLGYEGVMADNGTFLPKVNLKRIKRFLKEAASRTNAKRIIIDGDIKNEFSQMHLEEFNEFKELVDYLSDDLKLEKITLVKGNHDNFVDRIGQGLGIEIFSEEALIGGFLFFHGEGLPKAKAFGALVMGHVHPAITLYNDLGTREKLHCFLYGRTKKNMEIIVLPAMNYFAEGVGVNYEDISKMAPVFKSMTDASSLRALCIGEEEILDFGTVEELASLK